MSKWLTWGTSRETPEGHKIDTIYGSSDRTTSASVDSAEGREFSRFEDLTRKLVNVPKEEIDDKRREES